MRSPRGRRRAAWLLGASIFAVSVGISAHVAINVNFLHELLSASSWEQGYLESIRETCGILSFFVVARLVGRSETRWGAGLLALTGAGMAAYVLIETVPHVILCSLVWSFGFHVWVPLGGSLQLAVARRGKEGETLGTFGGVAACGVLVSLGSVYVLKSFTPVGLRGLFVLAGAVLALGAVPYLFLPDVRAPRRPRLPWSRLLRGPYRLFCTLELLDGMRRQIFTLFAVLVLVREHGVRVETIAALMFVNQAICMGLARHAGRLTDRMGERFVLSLYFTSVGAVFLCYAWASQVAVLFAVFILDNALFVLRVALPTFANRIVRRGERTQLLAVGVTMNHVGAVTLPVIGGALYAAWGHELPFYCGAAIAAVSLAFARRIPARRPSVA